MAPQVPDPSWLAGFDGLGPVGIMVGCLLGAGAIVAWVIRQFRTGALVTDIRHAEALAHKDEEIAELRRAREADGRVIDALTASNDQKHRDLLRLTDDWKTMSLTMLGRLADKAGSAGGHDA